MSTAHDPMHDPHADSPSAAREITDAEHWNRLALSAETDLHERFGHRLMGIPGTWIGALRALPDQPLPNSGARPWSEWHYWWQAHYLDAIIDAAFSALQAGERSKAQAEWKRAKQLLRGVLIRNFASFPNYFYDDMAWLLLAATRLNELSLQLSARPALLSTLAMRALGRQLVLGQDDKLGGGLYWSRKRDFKNTPSNGPAALYFARINDGQSSKLLLDWMRHNLHDERTGLYLDGIRLTASGPQLENAIYTYNQGTVLGALLASGSAEHLAQAQSLIESINVQLCDDDQGTGLRLDTGGDGDLFTGILCRYLALAALDPRLPAASQRIAARLICLTAAHLADRTETQLSAAIQRWTILQAAQRVCHTGTQRD
ncbi:glycoside hydrolase family 76 protein [Arthrobacter sp. MYb213]|uniref:glycoside hydrolase family 76 protein n=1 Tax=Arthrobacter sp. MYb213 TaxID=1848595 RepID=UPI000CFC74DF|nr:glycoside hydrolase family 76 protein [Arthrobacter sp. MYb213]PRB67460.1 glycosyl hydrolase [Arthrobacter sp. MYb213]